MKRLGLNLWLGGNGGGAASSAITARYWRLRGFNPGSSGIPGAGELGMRSWPSYPPAPGVVFRQKDAKCLTGRCTFFDIGPAYNIAFIPERICRRF